MALQNQISVSFTDDELKQIDDHIAGIEAIVKPKVVALTAAQNSLYGKLGNENSGWAETVYADCKQMPTLVPTDVVDVAEWDKDELARKQLSPRVSRLEALVSDMESTNRLLGFDIYNTCLSVYKYVKAKMELGVTGFKEFYEKWSVQFPGRRGGPKATKPRFTAKKTAQSGFFVASTAFFPASSAFKGALSGFFVAFTGIKGGQSGFFAGWSGFSGCLGILFPDSSNG